MGVSSASLSALDGGVIGIVVSAHRVVIGIVVSAHRGVISIVVSGCVLTNVKIYDYLSYNRPDCGWCIYENYSVSSGLEDA